MIGILKWSDLPYEASDCTKRGDGKTFLNLNPVRNTACQDNRLTAAQELTVHVLTLMRLSLLKLASLVMSRCITHKREVVVVKHLRRWLVEIMNKVGWAVRLPHNISFIIALCTNVQQTHWKTHVDQVNQRLCSAYILVRLYVVRVTLFCNIKFALVSGVCTTWSYF